MIKVKNTGPFKILYNLPNGTTLVIFIGGRGSGKTYGVSVFCAKSATIDKKRIAVLRDEKEKIRESILNEIFNRYDTANAHGHFDGLYDKIESGIRDIKTGQMLVFTMGFRASSKEKKSNLKGVSDVDIAVVEEAEDIRSAEKFYTLADSMRKTNRLIIVMLNTPDLGHWIVKNYFHNDAVLNENGEATGYFKLTPKEIPGFVGLVTNYKDNPNLPDSVIKDYESYADPNHPKYDMHHYYTHILGYASSGRKGQIITKAKPVKLADYVQLDYKEIYGLDFGTSSPAGLVGVKLHRNAAWCRQLNYLPKDTLGIGIMLCLLGFTSKELIIADSANPLDISKLRNGWSRNELTPEQIEKYPQLLKGFNILAAIKGPGSVQAGIRMMIGMELHYVEESIELKNEIDNYIYAVDKNEQPLDEPVDDFNHLIDPWRYVIMARGRLF